MAGLTAHPEVPFKESENAQSVEFYPWSLTVCDAEVNVYSEKVFPGFSLIEVTGWIPLQSGKQWLLCSLCWITEQEREWENLFSPLPGLSFYPLWHSPHYLMYGGFSTTWQLVFGKRFDEFHSVSVFVTLKMGLYDFLISTMSLSGLTTYWVNS